MSEFTYEPPLGRKPFEPATQLIRLNKGGKEIAVARWHAADARTGVSQILDFTVHAAYRRQGNGRRLMAATVEQCLTWHRQHHCVLRRMWGAVRQKEQVIARAFMLQHGFNHLASIHDLLVDEDALVYVKTFD